MVALVNYTTDDGTTVVFETAEADMVSLHTGMHLTEKEGDRLSDRLVGVAKAAQQITVAMKNAPEPDELSRRTRHKGSRRTERMVLCQKPG